MLLSTEHEVRLAAQPTYWQEGNDAQGTSLSRRQMKQSREKRPKLRALWQEIITVRAFKQNDHYCEDFQADHFIK